MTQVIMRNGQPNYFPDNASLDQINKALDQKFHNDISSSIAKSLTQPRVPPIYNVVTGLLSPFISEESNKILQGIAEGIEPGALHSKVERFAGEMMFPMGGGAKAAVTGAKAAGKAVEKGIEYLHPEKEIPKFMEKIGGGARTAEESIENISREAKLGRIAREEEALLPKRELMTERGKEYIFKQGDLETPNISKIAKQFGVKAKDITEDMYHKITDSLKKYYKSGGDEKTLINSLEDIFEHSGLEEKGIKEVEKLLPLGKIRASKYLSKENITKGYSEGLKEIHENFVKHKSAETADLLLSRMKREMRRIEDTAEKSGWTNNLENNYNRLKNNLSNLTSDFEEYIKSLPPELKTKYSDYVTKWKLNVTPYGEESVMKQLSKGKWQGITSSQIKSLFTYPTKDVLKVMSDIGREGKNYILHNILMQGNTKNLEKFAKGIIEAKNKKGMSELITPEMESFANNLLRRKGYRTFATDIAAGVGGAMLGGPLGGAAAYGVKKAYPYIAEAIKRMRK